MYMLRQGYEEAIHTHAYQYIVEALGMDESRIFNMYRVIESIYNKASFFLTFSEGVLDPNFKTGTLENDQKYVENLCVFALIVEGIFFYSSFAVMFGFQRQHKLTGSAELLFPMPGAEQDRSLRLAWFVDGGQVYANKIELGELRYSTGIALFWSSALGPLRLSWAHPLNVRSGDRKQQLQFTFGTGF